MSEPSMVSQDENNSLRRAQMINNTLHEFNQQAMIDQSNN